MEAEREIVALKKVQFMREKIGDTFDGYITGVTAFGFFVELIDLFVEGMVHISTLKDDFYRYVEKQHSLVGERLRQSFRIGDRVTVLVAAVSLERKQVEFVLAGLPAGRTVPAEAEQYVSVPVRGKLPKALAEKRQGKGRGASEGVPADSGKRGKPGKRAGSPPRKRR